MNKIIIILLLVVLTIGSCAPKEWDDCECKKEISNYLDIGLDNVDKGKLEYCINKYKDKNETNSAEWISSAESNLKQKCIEPQTKKIDMHTKDDHKIKEVTIDGVYIGSQNFGGIELTAELTIIGNSWSASSQLGYDSPEYQNGVVKGNELYDESGMIKVGYVSGNSASINGYPSMRK